jgi:putative flippase GtrA
LLLRFLPAWNASIRNRRVAPIRLRRPVATLEFVPVPSVPKPSWVGLRALAPEIGRFGVVGGASFLLDFAAFNVLLFTVLSAQPVTAKAIATTLGATTSYFLNRHWTWDHRARSGVHRELPLFLLLSGVGLLITEVCLVVSHYGFGFTSRLADNLAANGVGLVLGTTWRFLSYKKWVFLAPEGRAPKSSVGARIAA